MLLDWTQATADALRELWVGFVQFTPSLVGAIVILVVGWLVSLWVGRVVAEVFKRIRFNQLFEKTHWRDALQKADLKVDPSGFLGVVAKWVLMIVFLSAAAEVLTLDRFAGFLRDVLAFVPNVVVASLIFVVAAVITDLLEKVLRVASEGMQFGFGHAVGTIVRWAIWVFAALAILNQLNVDTSLAGDSFKIVLAGVVAMFALAFGLGGRDVAAEVLQDLRKKFRG
ncbi:MAG: hypothetical protein HYV78_00210 [Candidatus Wildermuthbacteria bacterium]|nr:hypothetical protein [Candidatus Wildermuthbacteria bacterium]